jgi:hypothetical protein
MGISIAYRGKLRDPGSVPALIDDLTAKARSVGWMCKTMKEMLAEGRVRCPGLEGVTLYPHRECEPLHFHFDEEGTFTNHTYYSVLHDPNMARMMREAMAESAALVQGIKGARKKEAGQGRAHEGGGGQSIRVGIPDMPAAPGNDFFLEGSRYNWTKTQFAGPKVHIAVCAMLRYVKQRYAPDLEIKDDSGYFLDGDEAKLAVQMSYIDRLVMVTSKSVEAIASSGGAMTLDEFVDRLNEELADPKSKLH